MSIVDGPLTLLASSACLACDTRHAVEVTCSLQAKPDGTYSIAGAQTKVVVVESTTYYCTACGANGPAEPIAPYATLAGLNRGTCGHLVAADHYPVGVHTPGVCPGCCPTCQDIKDGTR
jgi:hypothetical protein